MAVSTMTTISSDRLEPRHRTDFWRALSSPFYEVSPLVGGQAIDGRLDARLVGSVMVGRREFDARMNRRDSRHLANAEMDGYHLELLLDGKLTADCDGTDMRLEPGDIGVFDYTRAHHSRQTAGTSLMLHMPRDRIDAATGGRSAHGRVLRAKDPGTRLVASVFKGLVDIMADLDAEDATGIDKAMTDLIVASIAGREPAGGNNAAQQVLQQEILTFIRGNLADPDLGPAMLTHRFSMSRTHLYRLFPGQNGVARLIREERLKHALRDLQQHRNRTITTIAFDHGFSSSNQFLRAFRSHYKMTPSEARRQTGAFGAVTDLATHIARSAANPLHRRDVRPLVASL